MPVGTQLDTDHRAPPNEALWPDETLVEFAKQGSDSAFAALLVRYGDDVYTVVRNMTATASHADELTHQTFISAYREIASMPVDATFRTWLFGIAIKNFFAVRRGQVGAARSSGWPPTKWNEADLLMMLRRKWPDLTDPALELGNLTVSLREALGRMDDSTRAAFVLSDLAELPATETAAILQTSPREIHKRVHHARLTLIGVLGRCFPVPAFQRLNGTA